MINLNKYLKESLLDDEEDLATGNELTNDALSDTWDFLTNGNRNGGIELSKVFVADNQIKKGGLFTLIPVSGFPERINITNSLTDRRKIKYYDRKKGIYNGDYEIYKPIPDWPPLLKIGNPRFFTIYSKQPISQNMVPDLCVSLDIVHMKGVEGLEFNCRYANIINLEKINKPIIINTFPDIKNRAEIIDINNSDNFLEKWSDFDKIISNCRYISITKGDFVENIINKYDDPNKRNHYMTDVEDPELIKLQQKNFKNIETIYLYSSKNDNFFYLTFYKGKWEFHSNKYE